MIRILIADDHAILRAGIRALLQLHTDFEVVGEAADGHDALVQVQALKPDVVLMDIGMPGMGGLAATHEVAHACPGTRILLRHAESLTITPPQIAPGDVMHQFPHGAIGHHFSLIDNGHVIT